MSLPDNFKLKEHLDRIEYIYLIEALRMHNGLRSRAARSLGINRTTLIMKMKKHEKKKQCNIN